MPRAPPDAGDPGISREHAGATKPGEREFLVLASLIQTY